MSVCPVDLLGCFQNPEARCGVRSRSRQQITVAILCIPSLQQWHDLPYAHHTGDSETPSWFSQYHEPILPTCHGLLHQSLPQTLRSAVLCPLSAPPRSAFVHSVPHVPNMSHIVIPFLIYGSNLIILINYVQRHKVKKRGTSPRSALCCSVQHILNKNSITCRGVID